MRVLIDQQYHLGHHYHYIAHLLPTLVETAGEVIVAVTPQGLESEEFTNFLATFSPQVRFLPILPNAKPWLPLDERVRVHRALRDAVREQRPDYVLMPSGDAQATAMASYRGLLQGTLPDRVPCEAGIHLGTGASGSGVRRALDVLNAINLACSGLRRVHVVNLLFLEFIRSLSRAGNFSLVPSPVSPNPGLSKLESRKRLGIPEDGAYIGIAGSLDTRKAIPELLAAFRAASQRRDERVLLAGWLHPSHRRQIDQAFGDLLTQEKLIFLPGFLTPATYQTALTAMDVICTPYPQFAGLSATLLEAVAASRPVLANASGWMREMVRRFSLGWTCDVLDHAAFTSAVRHALDHRDEVVANEATRRLLAFHSPANFGRTWVEGIRNARGQFDATPLRWSWVEAAL
jgi:glycosyltransferase involved in cell wall biosynthesis